MEVWGWHSAVHVLEKKYWQARRRQSGCVQRRDSAYINRMMLRVELCRFPWSIHHSPKQQTAKDDWCLTRTLWLWAKRLTLLGPCASLSRTINLPSFLTWLPPSPIPQAYYACRMQQQRLITPEACKAHWTESHISKEERVVQKKALLTSNPPSSSEVTLKHSYEPGTRQNVCAAMWKQASQADNQTCVKVHCKNKLLLIRV